MSDLPPELEELLSKLSSSGAKILKVSHTSNNASNSDEPPLTEVYQALMTLQYIALEKLKPTKEKHPAKDLDLLAMQIGFLAGKFSSNLGRALNGDEGAMHLMTAAAPEGLALARYIETTVVESLNKDRAIKKMRSMLDDRSAVYHPDKVSNENAVQGKNESKPNEKPN